ncbi:beta-lactamase family protein [bacterium]|nr:beta-lactamase family protein [bacterium]
MNDDFPDAFPRLHAEIERGFERKLHRGLQLYVSLNGQIVVDYAVGEARPDQPMTTNTINRWLSSGKPITAVAIAILKQQGSIDWSDPVKQHLPEFAGEQITIKNLLNHTSGLPKVELGWPDRPWADIIAAVCETRPEAAPGSIAAYQPAATWFLLGEIIQRISGQSFSDFVHQSICEPLGMTDSHNGMSPATWNDYGDRIGMTWARRRAKLEDLPSHSQLHCTAPSPGGNFRGPIRELGRFYEMLLSAKTANQPNPAGLLQKSTIDELTSRHREDMLDHTFQHKIDFGLGFIIDSNHHGAETVPYGFGRRSSSQTFGHGGAESSSAFADPAHRLVVAWVANVRAGEGRHQTRNRAINSAIYEDLGLG